MARIRQMDRFERPVLVERDHDIHDARVKLRASIALQLRDRLFDRHALPVGPVGDHCVKGIHRRGDPGADGDPLPLQPLGVAGAVVRLLMTEASPGSDSSGGVSRKLFH